MITVELIPAYMWDCPECGRENFQRSISVVLDPADDDDADMIRTVQDLDPGETIPADICVRMSTSPERVTCQHCAAEFKSVDSGMQNAADDEG